MEYYIDHKKKTNKNWRKNPRTNKFLTEHCTSLKKKHEFIYFWPLSGGGRGLHILTLDRASDLLDTFSLFLLFSVFSIFFLSTFFTFNLLVVAVSDIDQWNFLRKFSRHVFLFFSNLEIFSNFLLVLFYGHFCHFLF